jgi:hypothetical protein
MPVFLLSKLILISFRYYLAAQKPITKREQAKKQIQTQIIERQNKTTCTFTPKAIVPVSRQSLCCGK